MKIVIKFFVLFSILITGPINYSCDKQSDWLLGIPSFEDNGFIALSDPLPLVNKISIEGIYKVVRGTGEFGDTLVLKTTKDKISFFGLKQGAFSIAEVGFYNGSIIMEGHWRHILSDNTGLIRLYINHSDSILNYSTEFKTVSISGLYGDGNEEPSIPIELWRIEKFSQKLLDDNFLILAHRGGGRNSDRLPVSENSIEMIDYSEYLGATGVEVDIYLTKDKIPVLYHDAELNIRLIQKSPIMGRIEDYTYSQLKTFVKLIHGEEIPTLENALKYILKNTSLRFVWLDMKDYKALDEVMAIQKRYHDMALSSGKSLQVLIGIPDDNVYNGLLSTPNYDEIPSLCELDFNKASTVGSKAWAFMFTQGYHGQEVVQMHQKGVLCIPWTIDYPKYINFFTSYGGNNDLERFDGILTNYPTILAYYHYVKHN